MNHRSLVRIFVAICGMLSVAVSAENLEDERFVKAVAFVSDASTYQAYFDSVSTFCAPYAPALILQQSRAAWDAANAKLMTFRDKQQKWVTEFATNRGATADKLDTVRSLSESTYRKVLAKGSMYKDLAEKPDLEIACSKRLGEMLADKMTFSRLAPESWAYYQEVVQEAP